MAKKIATIRIFISSPGDVAEERALTRKVIERLQGEYSGRVKLEPIYWEHEPLLATQTFQEQITRPSETDIVITILWSRLGTRLPAQFTKPDGSRYESGTEFEFEDAINSFQDRGTPDLLIYRKTADPQVSLKDKQLLLEKLKQKESLDNFFDKWFHDKTEGTLIAAFHPFNTSADFEEIFESHLSKLIKSRLPKSAVSDKILAIKPQWTEGSPFRGLSVFKYIHSPVFFGRTKAVSEIIDALRIQAASEKAFLLILGMSGGGKSSLVRAGVLPMITQPGVIEGVGLWRRAIMKPGDSPDGLFNGLAASLIKENALPELGADGTTFKELAKILRETPKAVVPLIKGGLSQAASEMAKSEQLTEQPTANLVLLVDQMEEMFTLESITHNDRKLFIEALDALSRSGRVWVIATLRSDFYPRTAELEGLVTLKEGTGQYDLLAPTTAEIGQMIRQPAQAAGLCFEEDTTTNERLDDVLRDAATKNPGALPLLEFTLEELYKLRTDNGMLTFEAYKKLGGVEGALAQRAEEVFGGLEPRVQQAMDVELHSLISIGVDDRERIARKYAPLEMLTATPETKAFVEAFVEARLFTTSLAADGSAVVNIAHEALLQNWPRLQDWIEQNRESLRIHARVSVAVGRWENENRSREFLLSAGKQVSEAEELVKNKRIELTDTEKTFVHASIAKRKRIWWIKRAVVAVLIVFAIAASGAAYLAMQQRDRAETEAKTSEQVSDFLVGLFEVSDPSEALGDTITAREILDKGAERIEKELSDQPEVQATLMNTMGIVYMNLGLYDQASQLLEKSLSNRQQLYGNSHLDVAQSLISLALLMGYKVEIDSAESLCREAVTIQQELLDEEDKEVATSLAILAWILVKQNEFDEAESIYRKVIPILKSILGEENRDVATCINNLGTVFRKKGDFESAEPLIREALTINRKIYGDDHPAIALLLDNLGQSLYRMEDYEGAELVFRESLDINRKFLGDMHPHVALSIHNLAVLLTTEGRYDEAEKMFNETLFIRRKIYGNEHVNVAGSLVSFASAIKKMGDSIKAEIMLREALYIYRINSDYKGSTLTYALNELAILLTDKGEFVEAEHLFLETLEKANENFQEGDWRTAITMRDFGDCLTKLKRYQEAETLLLESYQIFKVTLGEDHSRTKKCLVYIIALYEAWGKPEKVAEFEALLSDTIPASETLN